MAVPFFDIKRQISSIRNEIDTAISEVIDNGAFILGPKVKELEDFAAKYIGAKHAIGVASGTDALMLALKALNIKKDAEVITTPFTFVATLDAIEFCGATPVFVDIDPDTFNIDTKKIEAAITKKTEVILPVHLYGQPANMEEMLSIAKKYNLKVVEDAAQAIGAKYNNKYVGSLGEVGCFSFFPTKNLGCFGDGGLVTTNSDEIAKMLRILKGHGSTITYHYDFVGHNSRLDSIQAAILLIRFKYLEEWTNKRRENAKLYKELLKDIKEISLPKEDPKIFHVYNQFTIKVEARNELLDFLKSKNIGCAIYYPLSLHLQNAFKSLGFKNGDFPISEKTQESVISLPIFPELTREEIEEVVDGIKKFYGKS
ncbi:transcriptional regulator [candidate division WOR-1 bacterium RIFOXYA2_FULL_36_21]|uniref:Transcriptional regulator n=1 Tax=candidate division WOR-1 bacterium RIFOXYB2_FULL_36_35 TaxID=1802578 RepID=A0A1F4S0W8_UNCSA|nr:MAG: transcriptional regulator [candidate division WOR-1 bacterium RIFOXYA2_FULL_36_21]OGC14086.1 MAG: transcriptional regulator [candidate division WOR-1 bacterium RIFOXYB2_FULL_36_35]